MDTIFISDLDGTLVRNDISLSDYSRANLRTLLEKGCKFTVASARSVSGIKKILGDLPITLPIINFNGAFLSDYRSGKHQVINALSPPVARELFQQMMREGCSPFISTFDSQQDLLYYNDVANQGSRNYVDERIDWKDERLRQTSDLKATLKDSTICFTVIDTPEKVGRLQDSVKKSLEDSIYCTLYREKYPGFAWLTMSSKKATKDQAIKVLLDQFGLSTANLTVFGDDVNDISMFKLAARGVAVSNAVAELKQYATEIIGSNEDDAVVKYIQDDQF
jgi:Cof subfamily protein (haloacid dehalogenase superfamily)